jgi:hypothetical protein
MGVRAIWLADEDSLQPWENYIYLVGSHALPNHDPLPRSKFYPEGG